MKTSGPNRIRKPAGSALLMTLVMSGIALLLLTGAMTWSATSTRLTDRSNRYATAVAAGESAIEKVITQMNQDFLDGGESLVVNNLNSYRATHPTSADSAYWTDWEFNNASGQIGQTYIGRGIASNYVVLTGPYAGLSGYVSTYTLVSDARQVHQLQDVVAGVMEQVDLARIPIFQFALYSSGDMEISCGQPFAVTGRVHSNQMLYVEPDSALTFQSSVTAVGDILFQRDPADSRTPPVGSVVYQGSKTAHAPSLVLPIGTANTPQAIREIIEPPALGESPSSPMGHSRYYNQVDLLVTVSDTGVTASSGGFNNFTTVVAPAEFTNFVTLTNSFYDSRESKTILPVDLDIGALKSWSATNRDVRVALGNRDITSVYVYDRRTVQAGKLGAVRVRNGLVLPPLGLTVASASPIYVLGNYNQPTAADLGTANTTTTLPASLVGDAVTILSANWNDANSRLALASRVARPTTVNAAILAGAVETANGNYSGGMENFPRFLESWGLSNPLTYNGSMVKMFPSLYATNIWGLGNVYNPPKRDWAYDLNFNNPTKLPPLTPSLLKIFRNVYTTLAPNSTTPPPSS
ncbi:MAG TPA: hypothetical protein VFE51_00485 [Verrucomicrobiae bacterium]|nr:hypothetical protein [Verrucomicrobiae bacterium]